MPLGPDRILVEGESPHPWEREAIAFIKQVLPGGDPYLGAFLVSFQDTSGGIHEVDALVLGYHALYLIEVKSWPGTLGGTAVDWTVTFPDGRVRVYENPIHTVARKARILASLLERKIGDPNRRPWVEPLVFLSDRKLVVKLPEPYRGSVVTRETFARAVTFGEIPLADERLRARAVNRPMMRATAEALRAILVPSKVALRWGDFVMQRVIEEGPGWQDWLAVHESMPAMRRRLRVYPIPPSAPPEHRDRIWRAADREARLLTLLGDHRAILKVMDYRPEGPTGAPAVAFEDFDGGESLEAFIRRNPELSFDERIAIIEQIAEALAYCHGKRAYHRGLHPGAVLVRRRPNGPPEVRLYNFQLAAHEDVTSGTLHFSTFTPDPALLYRAPEVIEDPTRAGTVEADLFSLGAVAYYVLTGRAPGANLAERHELLAGGGLSLAAASDALAGAGTTPGHERRETGDAGGLDHAIRFATDPSPLARADDVVGWLNLLLEAATQPTPEAAPEVDPLEASPGETLTGGLVVERVLGSGSTARVFKVRRGEQTFALKVALSPEADERLAAEAKALKSVQSDRVVKLEAELTIAGRRCLLLGYAGETLAGLLAREGPPSLDYAHRWGEDLLLALGALEEHGILHRDIKPANLGVLPGEAKKARHLFLFDFSLAGADPSRIELGTPAYRDPFLATRKDARWDESSDRFSAAMTLHEMLTGVLPRYGTGGVAAVATDAGVTLAAERFDASVRDKLIGFFEKALDRDVSKRHRSAAEMRAHWSACFGPSVEKGEEARPRLDDAALAAVPPDASVQSLPLSAAAKNALDRSGVIAVRELLELPRNQLSSIRGVGRTTVREILDLVERYRKVRAVSEHPTAPFWPGYRGADTRLADVPGIPSDAVQALEDAGLGRLRAVAAGGKERIERILARFPGARDVLVSHLEAEQRRATGTPATIEGFVDALVPEPSGKRGDSALRHVRLLYGLDTLAGATPGDPKSIAAALRVTRAAIYVSLARMREKWGEQHERLEALHGFVEQALSSLGGAAPLRRLAEVLPAFLPHEAGRESTPEALVHAEALVRICAETDSASRLVLERVGDVLWAGATPAHLQAARALGAAADELARRDPLASAGEVERALAGRAAGTPFAGLSFERLVSLAVEASHDAARSARLEIYPRGMAAGRALRLCAGAIGVDVAPDEVIRLVASRYPEAKPLPPRPELDALLAELHLSYEEPRGRYTRTELTRQTSRTEALSPRRPTIDVPVRPRKSPDDQEATDFDQRIRLAAEQRHFKVLDVNLAHAEAAAEQLSRRLGVEPCSLEGALIAEAWKVMQEEGVEEEAVLEADREGPEGPAWRNLQKLMEIAADRLLQRLLAEPKPLVLTRPGLLARYRLDGFLKRLAEAAQDDKAPAIFLLNPGYEVPGPQPIHSVVGDLQIPTTSPAQRLRVPARWIKNCHRGEA